MRVGIGPPGGCAIEYRCHVSAIFAVTRTCTVSFDRLPSAMVHVIGFGFSWASAPNDPTSSRRILISRPMRLQLHIDGLEDLLALFVLHERHDSEFRAIDLRLLLGECDFLFFLVI